MVLSQIGNVEELNEEIFVNRFNFSYRKAEQYLAVAKWIVEKIGIDFKNFEEFRKKILEVLDREYKLMKQFKSFLKKGFQLIHTRYYKYLGI